MYRFLLVVAVLAAVFAAGCGNENPMTSVVGFPRLALASEDGVGGGPYYDGQSRDVFRLVLQNGATEVVVESLEFYYPGDITRAVVADPYAKLFFYGGGAAVYVGTDGVVVVFDGRAVVPAESSVIIYAGGIVKGARRQVMEVRMKIRDAKTGFTSVLVSPQKELEVFPAKG